jgi:hypothetical protein
LSPGESWKINHTPRRRRPHPHFVVICGKLYPSAMHELPHGLPWVKCGPLVSGEPPLRQLLIKVLRASGRAPTHSGRRCRGARNLGGRLPGKRRCVHHDDPQHRAEIAGDTRGATPPARGGLSPASLGAGPRRHGAFREDNEMTRAEMAEFATALARHLLLGEDPPTVPSNIIPFP